jgi:autotransporter passenger strand-loop-strand repeat protein
MPINEIIVSAGQTSSGLSEYKFHNEVVLSGGTAESNQVGFDGDVFVSSGGVTISDVVFSGGTEVLSAGAEAFGPLISAGGVVAGGGAVFGGADYGLLSGVTIEPGAHLPLPTLIESGGSASAVTVDDGGALELNSGGLANHTVVLNGYFDLLSGSQEAYAVVSGPNARMEVGGGSTAFADEVVGGTMVIDAGALQQGTISAPVQDPFVSSGGVISNFDYIEGAQVAAGGVLIDEGDPLVEFGYLPADMDSLVYAGGVVLVSGASTGATVYSGGVISVVSPLANVFGAEVQSGGVIQVNPFTFTGSPGAHGPVQSNTFDSGAVLSCSEIDFRSNYTDVGQLYGHDYLLGDNTFSGGSINVGSAIVEADVLLSLDGSVVGGATASSHSLVFVEDGAVVSAATVLRGAQLLIEGANSLVGKADVRHGGVIRFVDGQGSVDDATVASGGIILGKARVFVDLGGDLQGVETVYGVVRSVTLGGFSSATMTVESGGVASGVVMGQASGSLVQVVSGGSAVPTFVSADDVLTVASGSTVSGTRVYSKGARAYISGLALNTVVAADGADLVVSGSANGVRVGYGGIFEDDGAATGVQISKGGSLILDSAQAATDVTVAAGASVEIDSGSIVYSAGQQLFAGTLKGNGNLVKDGSGVLVMQAATTGFTGDIVLSAGDVALGREGEASQATITYETSNVGATLRIWAVDRPISGSIFAPTLNNFDSKFDHVDLVGLAFVSGAKATVSKGVLTVTDGAYSAAFALSGAVASRYNVVGDGAGGTLIQAAAAAPAVLAASDTHAAVRFTQAIASLESGGATEFGGEHSVGRAFCGPTLVDAGHGRRAWPG